MDDISAITVASNGSDRASRPNNQMPPPKPSVRGAGASAYAVQDAGNYQMYHDECSDWCSTILTSKSPIRAVEAAIAEEMRTGKNVTLSQKMLAKALKSQRPTTLEWLNQASNYASFANQSGLYDDLSQYLKDNT